MTRKFEETKDIIEGARDLLRRLCRNAFALDQDLTPIRRDESADAREEAELPAILNIKHYP